MASKMQGNLASAIMQIKEKLMRSTASRKSVITDPIGFLHEQADQAKRITLCIFTLLILVISLNSHTQTINVSKSAEDKNWRAATFKLNAPGDEYESANLSICGRSGRIVADKRVFWGVMNESNVLELTLVEPKLKSSSVIKINAKPFIEYISGYPASLVNSLANASPRSMSYVCSDAGDRLMVRLIYSSVDTSKEIQLYHTINLNTKEIKFVGVSEANGHGLINFTDVNMSHLIAPRSMAKQASANGLRLLPLEELSDLTHDEKWLRQAVFHNDKVLITADSNGKSQLFLEHDLINKTWKKCEVDGLSLGVNNNGLMIDGGWVVSTDSKVLLLTVPNTATINQVSRCNTKTITEEGQYMSLDQSGKSIFLKSILQKSKSNPITASVNITLDNKLNSKRVFSTNIRVVEEGQPYWFSYSSGQWVTFYQGFSDLTIIQLWQD